MKDKHSEGFFTASFQQIKGGELTDCYFQRALQILKARGINKRVVAEVFAKDLPHHWSWGVLGGVEEVVRLFKGFPLVIKGLQEGTFFSPRQPVLSIEGNYIDFCLYETAVLGLLCQSSGITTAAARCRKAAGDRVILSFGARRMHPTISPMIERSA
ncbi:MAG: nicotinate phosphoribosyltransferase, partial [Candidatus Aminicenantes bacterium]|nr:nicotinate phosphoribosyltransferase [Candidatus Aminicenantes bacterium]